MSRRLVFLIAILLSTATVALAQNPPAGTPADPACLAAAARTSRQQDNGVIRFIGTAPGQSIRHPRPQQAGGSAANAARAYLAACGPLFGLQNAAAEMNVTDTLAAGPDRTVVRLQQVVSNVPVIGGQMILHLDNARNIVAVVAKTLPSTSVDTSPTISPGAAIQIARTLAAKEYGGTPAGFTASAPELSVYDPALIGPGVEGASLVWRMDVTRNPLEPIREFVLVDAHRGAVSLHFNQVEDARNRLTYTAGGTTTLPGTLVCNEANTCLSPPEDSHVAAAHLYAGDTYDFYLSNHGRDSIDNAGMTITSTVHYAVGYQNAFWNGSQMVYGDGSGFPLADDVVAHELTHGVTQYTSKLFYFYQSGAINESLSDVWGELVDLSNGHGTDTAGVRWLLGEDISGIGPLRSMKDPTMFNDPDKMTSALYYTGQGDNGGVHSNSGVGNKAAYLMVDGGTFNGKTVTGLGITKVIKIYYEVQTHLLTSGADYADLADDLYQGCKNLIGTAGITLGDCGQVALATSAVEMDQQPTAGFNTESYVCPAGQSPINTFFDNLESGSGNFAFAALAGSTRWQYDSPYGPFAHSGVHFLYADDLPEQIADTTVSMTSSVLVPANAFLHFAHAFAFEGPDFDGGVVEYSTNGGSTWIDAGSLFESRGYTGTVNTGYSNPLGGRQAFVDDSHGYISSRLNLSSLSGQNVRFRWRMGLDINGYYWGWWLDDVRIYTCSGKKRGQVTSF